MVTTEVIAHVATAHVEAKVLPNASPALPGLAFVPTHLAQIATLENSMLSSKQGRSERIAMWTAIFASVTLEAQLASLDSIKTNVDAAAMASVGSPGPALLAPTPHQPADDEGKEVPSQCSIDTVFMIHPTHTTQVPTPHEGNSLVSLTDRCSCYSYQILVQVHKHQVMRRLHSVVGPPARVAHRVGALPSLPRCLLDAMAVDDLGAGRCCVCCSA
jgi:hypothetical protein